MCTHRPPCPLATAADRELAQIVIVHAEQGWSLLCNGIVTFDGTALMLPDGTIVTRRTTARTSGREPAADLSPADRERFRTAEWLLPETSRLA
jgi:hypothetical protein